MKEPDRKYYMKAILQAISARLAGPLFMVYVFEALAVFLFLVMAVEMLLDPGQDYIAMFNLIGFFVLCAWLLRKINKVIYIPDYILGLLLRRLLTIPIPGSLGDRQIQPQDLCLGHRRSFQIAVGVFIVVSVIYLVTFLVSYYAESSSVISTLQQWTKRCTILLMFICAVWIIGTLCHAHKCGCIKELIHHSGRSRR